MNMTIANEQTTFSILLTVEQFLTVCARIVHVAAPADYDTILSAVNIKTTGDQIAFCATDGSRMAVFQDVAADASQSSLSINVPAQLFPQLKKVANKKAKGQLLIKTNGYDVTLTLEGASVSGRLLPGEYPRYDELFPTKFDYEITFNPQFLADAAKGAEGRLTVNLSGALKPAIFQDGDKRVKHLLMPIQAKDAHIQDKRKGRK